MAKPTKKRPAANTTQGPSKRRKIAPAKLTAKISRPKHSQKPKDTTKDKAADRETISIPVVDNDGELSDQDLEVLEAYGDSVAFLQRLDQKAIARSKKETERLHALNKPVRKAPVSDDLPSLDSHDEDGSDWSCGFDGAPSYSGDTGSDEDDVPLNDLDSDGEMPYEAAPRHLRQDWTEDRKVIHRLPIKLSNGRIQQIGTKVMESQDPVQEEESTDSEEEVPPEPKVQVEDVSTGARFGRPSVVDVIGMGSRQERIQRAKEQIAVICQDLVADPENSLGLLRRLHSFSLAKISTPSHPEPVSNDIVIRKLAMLSELAVFKDIIPGYRVRALTEKEKEEKVSQMVARTREWEHGLVAIYQTYLKSLEAELKARSDLADIALQCICTLATEVTHFNFRVNVMSCIVARLSKKTWDESSQLCLDTLIRVFRADFSGVPSLEIVRLLHRMIKEKRFNVHPSVLSCLLHLRLKTELSVRSSESKTDRPEHQKKAHSKGRAAARRAKGKATDQVHLSKKARKALKEKKEIEKEFNEAEAEVDKEERAATQTETLKLLFVLYFRILKNPHPTPLLPAALQGISKYAHLVNIDFFKDLLQVLKALISRGDESSDNDVGGWDVTQDSRDVELRLLCIVTAFELLSGQGEALNIDLSDFINHLYTIILPLSLVAHAIEGPTRPKLSETTADLLFRALHIVFSPRTLGATAPSWRSAAFSKRLLTASLHWPAPTALRALDLVAGLLAKDSRLEVLLGGDGDQEDRRTFDGGYRAELDDPQACNPLAASLWELQILRMGHYDRSVRERASTLCLIRAS